MIEVEGANEVAGLGTSMWTSHVGTEYRFAVLKAQHEHGLAYVGLVAMAAQNDQGLAAKYWELSTAIGTRLLELNRVAWSARHSARRRRSRGARGAYFCT